MDNRVKYILAVGIATAFMVTAYYYPAETFLAFTVGWLFFIPAAFIVYMVYGYMEYMKEKKHRIEVMVKPTEAMRALARREEELNREKKRILYEEFSNKAKQ
ncbi:MAG TPA: hypothetical protein VIO11_02040 [Candidatus Methanoperedens sp.]